MQKGRKGRSRYFTTELGMRQGLDLEEKRVNEGLKISSSLFPELAWLTDSQVVCNYIIYFKSRNNENIAKRSKNMFLWGIQIRAGKMVQ